MSTIEKILSSLSKQSEDKKLQITNSFQEKSVWLKNEFDLIRKLIRNNHRDQTYIPSSSSIIVNTTTSPSVVLTNEVAGGVSIQSLKLIKQDDDFQSRKRKSPETAYTITNQVENKVSPEYKRVTPQVVDIDDILTKLGLPVNLDRLTKGQLLQELEIRGNTFFTMKSLKKELIDGLKDLLIEEHRQSNQKNKESIQQTTNVDIEQVERLETIIVKESIDDVAPASLPITIQIQPTPGKPVRKGSLMAEFRNLVNNSNTSMTNNNINSIIVQSSDSSLADNEASDKAAAEFQARQIRHRDSMARKSQVIAADTAAPSHIQTNIELDEQRKKNEDSSSFDDDNMQSDNIQVVEGEEEEIQTPEENSTNGTTTTLVTEVVTLPHETIESIWQEVASPMREVEHLKAEIKTTLDHHVSNHIPKETTHSKPTITTSGPKMTHSSNDKHATTTQMSSSSNNVKAAVAALQKPKPIINTLPSSKATTEEQKILPKSNPSVSSTAAASMKINISNTNAAPKPVTISTTSTWGSTKTNVSKPTTVNTTATTNNSSVSSTTNTAAVVKKGIFSGMSMFGAKKHPVVASHVPTLATANDSKKISAISTAAVVSIVKTTATSASVVPAFDINATTDDISPAHNVTSIKTTTLTPTDNKDPKSSILSAAAVPLPPSTNPTTIQNTATSAVKLKDAFVSRNMISNIVNNYNAIVAPKINVSSSENISVLKDITPTITNNNTIASAAVNTTTVIVETYQHNESNTPSAKEYTIEDRDSSDDDDGGSGTDDEEQQKKKDSIPEWARGQKLKDALDLQYGANPVDPDLIFPEVQSCSLEAIFGCREGINRKYNNRTSSAHWDADELTLVEKRSYRKHMGYDPPPMPQAY